MQLIWFQFVPPAVLGNAVALDPITDPLVAMVVSGQSPDLIWSCILLTEDNNSVYQISCCIFLLANIPYLCVWQNLILGKALK